MPQDRLDQRSPRTPGPSLAAAVARLYWFLGGTSALYLIALALTQCRAPGWRLHAAYWAIVASLLLVRYIDVRWLNGATASGEPASLQHWRGYVTRVLLAGSALSVASQLVARVGIWGAP